MSGVLSFIKGEVGETITNDEVRMMNPLVLAYIGDAVYDLFIRTYLIHKYDTSVHQLHMKATRFVKAASQSEVVHKLEGILTEDEKYIVRRGRNAKSATVPKNADVTEYRWATGFESLLGYLFLTESEGRLCEIMSYILENHKATMGEKI